jgi:hypothetical protein
VRLPLRPLRSRRGTRPRIRRTGPPSPDDNAAPPPVARLNVAVVPELAVLRPGLEFTSRGRFRCDVDVAEADVLVVTPCSPSALQRLRQRVRSSMDVVVLDRRGSCAPQRVADMLDGGATTVVRGASPAVLVAHLDAVARRRLAHPA